MKPGSMLSITTPAWNEARNLPLLYPRIVNVLDGLAAEWEWVVVDDHSSDGTFAVLQDLARRDGRVRGVRLARRSGSHAATLCGLTEARGAAAVVLAADLQDPPEILPALIARWRAGAQVVWAARAGRPGPLSRLYYTVMRRLAPEAHIPPNGTDAVLVDRIVLDALGRFPERYNSLIVLLAWMGFRQESVPCDKGVRRFGDSGWTMKAKIALFVDAVTAFTYWPIRLMSYAGILTALAGFAYAGIVVLNALAGRPPSGWSSLMVVLLVVGGMQMLMMGVLGEYVWRALGEARRRPRYLIEETTRGPE